MTVAGEIYHRACPENGLRWTSFDEPGGKCPSCGQPIPEDIMRSARELRDVLPQSDPEPARFDL